MHILIANRQFLKICAEADPEPPMGGVKPFFANNFLNNQDTGFILPPSCFSRQDASDDMFFDLKNLILKFDLKFRKTFLADLGIKFQYFCMKFGMAIDIGSIYHIYSGFLNVLKNKNFIVKN